MFSYIINQCNGCIHSLRSKYNHRFSRTTSKKEREMEKMSWKYDDYLHETNHVNGNFFTPSSNSSKGSYDFSIRNDYEFQIR